MRILSIFPFFFTAILYYCQAQSTAKISASPLKLTEIMNGYDWIGSSPNGVFWSEDSKRLYFQWNPANAPDDSLHHYSTATGKIEKMSLSERLELPGRSGEYTTDKKWKVYSKQGDLYLMYLEDGSTRLITKTLDREYNPRFSVDEASIFYQRANNVFQWHIQEGWTQQLTDFRPGKERPTGGLPTGEQREWIQQEELGLIHILRSRKEQREQREAALKLEKTERPNTFYYGSKSMQELTISPDGQYITFRLRTSPQGAEYTAVPDYIRESGYTDDLRARPKVGSPEDTYEFAIYNRAKDTVYWVDTESIPGIHDRPAYLAEYQEEIDSSDTPLREVMIMGPVWSEDSRHAVVVVRSLDFKDRWIMKLDPNTGQLRNLDRQHDEAWIDGPGISAGWGP